jgi:hypothetical protein
LYVYVTTTEFLSDFASGGGDEHTTFCSKVHTSDIYTSTRVQQETHKDIRRERKKIPFGSVIIVIVTKLHREKKLGE